MAISEDVVEEEVVVPLLKSYPFQMLLQSPLTHPKLTP
jgi:hypothetical protein